MAGVAGAAGVGIGAGAAKLGSVASKLVSSKLGGKIVTQAANVAGDLVSSAVGSKIQGNEISAGGLITDVAGGAGGRKVEGAMKAAAANSPAGKLLQNQADRAARVAVVGRASRVAAVATEKAANHGATKAAIAGGVGSGFASKVLGTVSELKEKPKQ
ncbi:hypothetical protein [Pedobacter gandavensis]|uniref:hypothetical protein n=1 Tax=Pedobacter gandavensis TaxID=2679963 RepID=UPI00293052F5|nr:hypothetical protein [Pedobacter gandavensis]